MNSVKFLVLFGAVMAGSAAFARTEPNSFLNRPAGTVSALVQQAKTDPQVMGRFQRHFGWSKPEVVNFLSSLRPGTLKQDGVYLVYNVNKSEEINAKVIFYKKGTRVWENAAGEPMMKVSCANPMVRGTDDRMVDPPLIADIEDGLRPMEAVIDGEAQGEVVEAILPVDPSLEAQVAPGALMASMGSVPLLGAAAGFNPLWLTPLAGLAAIRTGGGNDDPENPPPPVPEPATLLVIGAGAAALAARKRAKKS
jgi:hypothetical protein